MFNSFDDEVHVYQTFVRNNFNLLGANYEIIKEQFVINSGIIDILAYNKIEQRLVIIELKNIITTNKVLAQAMKYYNEIKFSTINNYEINNTPEIIIIAPEFDKNFRLYNEVPTQLIQLDYDNKNKQIIYSRFFPNKPVEKQELTISEKKTTSINYVQKQLANNIINQLKKLYDNQLKVITYNDHIDILSKKMLLKITFSTDWFNNDLQLNVYNNLLYNINKNSLIYDPAIKKISHLKTMLKLKVNNVPYFLQNI